MCWKDDSRTSVSSTLRGSSRNTGKFSVVCASLLELRWDQTLGEALIRGRDVTSHKAAVCLHNVTWIHKEAAEL